MKIKSLFTLALAGLAFAACSNDDETNAPGSVEAGKPTWVSFKVAENGTISSRGIGGTDPEEDASISKIDSGYVYIFKEDGLFEKAIRFDDSKSTAIESITTGKKQFVVLANRGKVVLTTTSKLNDLKGQVNSNSTPEDLVTDLQAKNWLLSSAIDNYTASNAAGNFLANIIDVAVATEDEVKGGTNNYNIEVSRAVARSKFFINSSIGNAAILNVEKEGTKTATLESVKMQYSNLALSSNTFLQVKANKVASPFFEDNFSSAADIAAKIRMDVLVSGKPEFKDIPVAFTYLPENSYKNPAYGQATNIYFGGTFTPVKVVNGYTTASKVIATQPGVKSESFIYDDLTDMYYLYKLNANYTLDGTTLPASTEDELNAAVQKIWVAIASEKGVYDIVKDLGSWTKEAGATLKTGSEWPSKDDIYNNTNGARDKINPVKAKDGKYYLGNMYKMRTFTDGAARYRIYLTDKDANELAFKNVIRNYSYHVTLNGVTGPGIADGETYPGGKTEGEGSGTGTPEDPIVPPTKPDPDPETPVDPTQETYIKATILIKPWVKVNQGAVVG